MCADGGGGGSQKDLAEEEESVWKAQKINRGFLLTRCTAEAVVWKLEDLVLFKAKPH